MYDVVKKLWGCEIIYISNELYCYKELILLMGFQSSLHYHKIKDETFIVKEGKIELEHEGKIHILKKDDIYRIKPGEKHRFKALEAGSSFCEISTHDDPEDSYRIEVSKKI